MYPLSVRKGARFCEKTVELRQVCMGLVFIAAKQFVVKFCRGASSVIELQNSNQREVEKEFERLTTQITRLLLQ